MPEGNLHAKPELTLEARKRLLLVACTIDRLHFLNTWKRPPAENLLAQLGSPAWLEFAAQFASTLLPRKLRFLLSLVRSWSALRRRS